MAVAPDNPVFLLGMPRSGTTWLSQVFESSPDFVVRLSPPYAYAFRGQVTKASSPEDWRAMLSAAIESRDRFVTQDWRRDTGELGAFNKDPARATRLAVKDTRFHDLYAAAMAALPAAKLVYIVRHPAAALWSWRNCKEFPAEAKFEDEWRNGQCRKREGEGEYWGFDDWATLSAAYLDAAKAAPDRYHVVRYEDLVRRGAETAETLFAFCDMPMRPETLAFLKDSQTRFDPRPYSVFKGGKSNDAWRSGFPEDILSVIEDETQGRGLGEYLV